MNILPQKKPFKGESGDSLYLGQLKYTRDAEKTFLNFFIQNFRVIILCIIVIMAWGLVSFSMLPLESNPEVKIPYGIITVALPGASPADVEELIVKKVESKVANLSGIKQVVSTAANSFAAISVEFRAEEDLDDAIRRLRDAVATIKTDLPAEASDPVVSEISFDKQPVWTLVVTGPYDSFTLRRYANNVKDELEKLPGTSEVTINGGDEYEILISYDPSKLKSLGLTADMVNGLVRASNLSLPLGNLEVSKFEYSVRTSGEFNTAAELRKLPLMDMNGQTVRLQDAATVLEKAKKRDVQSTFSIEGKTPENAITINVVKKTGFSIIDLIDGGKRKISDLKNTVLPADVHVETTLDISKIIRRDFNQLQMDGGLTILLVIVVLFMFVGLKEAFVAGLAVPLVFAATFGMMLITGITLNFLSLFSLILALGLLVDDAIVVVQATKQYLKTGKFTPEEAVLLVFKDFKVLLITTTLTTIWAFLPLVLASGIIGQFIRSIPITVSVTLAASVLIAIVINHPMAIILERFRVTRGPVKAVIAATGLAFAAMVAGALSGNIPVIASVAGIAITGIIFFSLIFWYRKSLRSKLILNEDLLIQEKADPEKIKQKIYHHYLAADSEKSFFARLIGGILKMDKILPHYGRILHSILASKLKSFLVLGILILIFFGAVALPATGVLKSEFLPSADAEYLYINIKGPPGLITSETKKIADRVQKILLDEKTIQGFTLVVGAPGVQSSGGIMSASGSGGNTNLAQFAINLYPLAERPKNPGAHEAEKSYDIASRIRKSLSGINGATIDVVELKGGPPSGAAIEGQIIGEDMKVLEREANRLKDLLSTIPGVVNAKTSINMSPGEFTFKLDPDRMASHGITSAQVASTLRTALSGVDVTKVFRGEDEVSVRAEFDEQSLPTIDSIKSLQLQNSRGQYFQLSDIADVSLDSAVTSIYRIDQKRVVLVNSGVEAPALPTDVLAKFQELIKQHPLPNGYEIVFGGENESNTESIYSILRAMIFAFIMIVSTLVIQFNSFRKAVLVLATIPLALTGVFYGLTIAGFTLSFPSLIGILALFGIVVKNAIILVDKINLNLRVGIPYIDAIVDASKSRMEAIFLTSICTILGMMPLTLHNETWEGLGAALIFGLSTSTFLTLFIIPVIFKIAMEGSNRKDERLRALLAGALLKA